MALVAAACAGDSSVDPVEVRNLILTVEPTRLVIAEGQNGELRAELVDDDGRKLPTNDLVWRSSNPGVAAIDEAGRVTGLASGSVIITVSTGGTNRYAEVNVRGKGQLKLHRSSGGGQSGPAGEVLSQPLVVEVRDRVGGVAGVEVEWKANGTNGSLSAPSTATNQNGLTQVLWTLGSALDGQSIQARIKGGSSVEFQATATQGSPASVTVSPADASLDVGDEQRFSAAVADQFGNAIEDAELTWVSTAADVVQVDSTGMATAMSAGSAIVEAYAGEASGGAEVQVAEPIPDVANVEVRPGEPAPITPGESLQFEATAVDGSGAQVSGITLTWGMSDSSIAEVNDMGLLTANAVGTAYLIASAACCEAAADTISVTVEPVQPTSVQVSPSTLTLDVGQTASLDVDVRDSEGSVLPAGASWSSGNPAVAIVDDRGVVTAFSEGLATIKAAVGDESATAKVTVAAPTLSAPGRATDLAHTGSGVLEWTQVDDGAGQPADYAIRYGCPTLSWGSAYPTEVTVSGTAIDQPLEYDTNQASGSCQYQLVAYRGALNIDAAFGALSNVETIAFETAQVPASIVVSPDDFSLEVGQAQQLSVAVLDESGAVIDGEKVAWASTAPSVASIGASSGLVTALAEGSVTFKASLVSSTGTSAASTPTSGPNVSSNSELEGTSSATVRGDDESGGGGRGSTALLFSDDFESGDRSRSENGASWAVSGKNVNVRHMSQMRDGASPASGNYALEFYFKGPTNQIRAEQRFFLGDGTSELWVEYWIYVPTNYHHRDDPNGSDNNKMFRLWSGNYGGSGRTKVGGDFHLRGDGDSNGRFLATRDGGAVISYLSQLTNGGDVKPMVADPRTGAFGRGQWTRFRYHVRLASGAGQSDGTIEAWIGSRKVLDQSGLTELYAEDGINVLDKGYLFGTANSGFGEDTYLYVDDVRFWAANPGW